MRKIGQNIRMIREIRNYSQRYMANMLSMSQPSYSDIENGKTSLSKEKIIQVAQILEIEIEFIMDCSVDLLLLRPNNYSTVNILDIYRCLLKQKDEEIKTLTKLLGINVQRLEGD